MDIRKAVAEQIGNLILANLEQAALIADLEQRIKVLGERLHASQEPPERSGQVTPPDEFRGS